jgi:hypothetical protein
MRGSLDLLFFIFRIGAFSVVRFAASAGPSDRLDIGNKTVKHGIIVSVRVAEAKSQNRLLCVHSLRHRTSAYRRQFLCRGVLWG